MFKARFLSLLTVFAVLPLFGFTTNNRIVRVPIVMYHSITNVNCNDYALSPAKLRSDLRYLTERGYKTVFVRDLVRYAEGKGNLPDKPVVISFDDGFYNNYSAVLPILNECDAVASFCVVGKFVAAEENAAKRSTVYSYVNLSEIAQMAASGRAEFGNHTYDMHSYNNGRKGVRRRKDETTAQYKKALTADTRKNEELFKPSGIHFDLYAYPYGYYSPETPGILSELGYKAILTCTGGINEIKRGDLKSLLHLKRYNRPSKYTSQEFFTQICKIGG